MIIRKVKSVEDILYKLQPLKLWTWKHISQCRLCE